MHPSRYVLSALAGLALLGSFQGAKAEGTVTEDTSPIVQVLKCTTNCGKWSPAQRIGGMNLYYPHERYQTHAEGFVELSYSIGTNGRVQDLVVIQQQGPQIFVDRTVETVSAWPFRPALQDGLPVEQKNLRRAFYFYESDVSHAHKPSLDAYNTANQLAASGKVSDAIAILLKAKENPETNFYERCTIAYLLALDYMKLNDYPNALRQIRDATRSSGWFLLPNSNDPHFSRDVRKQAVRLRFALEAHEQQYGEALAWFDALKKEKTIEDDDPEVKVADAIKAAMAKPDPIAIPATVSSDDAKWTYAPFRHNFGFDHIKGKLSTFTLRCDQQSISSAITEEAHWTVPQSFTHCFIEVLGTPGTTFQFLEAE